MFHETCNALLDIVFPRICAACDFNTPVRHGIFCMECLTGLPETNLHLHRDNFFTMHFWGRVAIEFGSAFLYYVPGGNSQKLIHNIKYRRKAHYAQSVGEHYGNKLNASECFQHPDCIVPVPLHWKKEQKRGFNQSAAFGTGLSISLGIPCVGDVLIRDTATATQTSKSREDRVRNMKHAFALKNPSRLRGKHLLLVDDVLTTGATLETCARMLFEIPGIQLSMATIAMGRI